MARPTSELSLDDLGSLSLFASVIEAGSFTAAARRRGTTTSAISKRIAALERRLGVRLLERTTRTAAPTEAGNVLYEHCRRLMAEAQAAEDAVAAQRGQLRGTIRVSAPVTLGQMHIAPLVLSFLGLHPGLRVALSLNDRKVDLIAEGVDLVVRTGRADDSSLVSRKLATDRRVICGSPDYLRRHGTPRTPDELREHECLRHPWMGSSSGWLLTGDDGPITVPVSGRLEIDNIAALRDAAVAGLGLAFLPSYAIASELAAKRLVVLLEASTPDAPPFRALWAPGKHAPARVLALVEHFALELPKRLRR